jgi:DNA-binding response OmpR family regulator
LSKERRRILLVDDDPDNNRIFAMALHDNGFEVHAFEDPHLALSAFKPNHYDLVILDITMPKMHGDELSQKLRKLDDKLKVCFITASEPDQYKTRFLSTSLDSTCFMRKPISIDKLVEKVNEIFIEIDKQK